jgi:hypothetical protein
MMYERRGSIRYPFFAQAEATEVVSATRLNARTSDLSLTGCYLEMMNPSPVGTEVRISISYGSENLVVLGTVTYVLQNMGMGIAFKNVGPAEAAILGKWIAQLAGK